MPGDSTNLVYSLEQLRPLFEAAQKSGVAFDLPGLGRTAPTVNVTQPIRQLALELGRMLAKEDLFLKGELVVTVDRRTGEVARMTPTRFVGWVEEFCAFTTGGRGVRMRDSLTREDATTILDQDVFRQALRPLDAVHLMRLPVRREGGDFFPVEFLPAGYDAGSRIFTVEEVDYAMDWTLEQAVEWLDAHGAGYPWSGLEEGGGLSSNRSWSVQVGAMLGVYCRALFPPGTPRPMVAYIGNQPGTGKSTLVSMALMPVYGHASATKTPKDDAEMDKELETAAQTYAPYLFFDDIGGGIFSNPLNRFITASSLAGRVMGGNKEMFRVPAVTQVFATGNDIRVSADLMRRSLVVELFLAGEVRGRKFGKVINSGYLGRLEVRKSFLAALCALVRHAGTVWKDTKDRGQELPLGDGIESFEDYTRAVSFMVQAAGYNDPLQAPDLSAGGAEDEDELKELLVKAATEARWDREFTREELVELARGLHLLEGLVGMPGDKIDASGMKRWGRQLQKYRGRVMVDANGRKFQFAHKRQRRGAKYPLTFKSGKPREDVEAQEDDAPELATQLPL